MLQAESVLPPGQSGYVSVPGVASGTGSPHLSDQTSLFTSFGFKSAMFDQGGDTEIPGRSEDRARPLRRARRDR